MRKCAPPAVSGHSENRPDACRGTGVRPSASKGIGRILPPGNRIGPADIKAPGRCSMRRLVPLAVRGLTPPPRAPCRPGSREHPADLAGRPAASLRPACRGCSTSCPLGCPTVHGTPVCPGPASSGSSSARRAARSSSISSPTARPTFACPAARTRGRRTCVDGASAPVFDKDGGLASASPRAIAASGRFAWSRLPIADRSGGDRPRRPPPRRPGDRRPRRRRGAPAVAARRCRVARRRRASGSRSSGRSATASALRRDAPPARGRRPRARDHASRSAAERWPLLSGDLPARVENDAVRV